jgi:5'-nucleotidase
LKKILVTNDDGIDSRGIAVLADAMQELGEVFVIAPADEMSAISHALTLNAPLSYKKVDERKFKIYGTPSDCVYLGVAHIISERPDLVVSGINIGQNMGEDITYSGTVAAAFEGCILGIPSIAFSLLGNPPKRFESASAYCTAIAREVMKNGLPESVLLNVNYPDSPIKGHRITCLGARSYSENVHEIKDPRGKMYYWIGGEKARWKKIKGSDYEAVMEGYVSITPLHLDLTHKRSISDLAKWTFKVD